MLSDASESSDEEISELRIREREVELKILAEKRRLAEKRKRTSSPTKYRLEPPPNKSNTT
ncbi:hypothetical protein FRC19_003974 [Serendipita sp. 401]|nr:hypothetical protein FRC19_003974 [Serendipita sp. 401]KAG9047477.1 hypothetical protein FS842_000639 [Serendipita sp. 407]